MLCTVMGAPEVRQWALHIVAGVPEEREWALRIVMGVRGGGRLIGAAHKQNNLYHPLLLRSSVAGAWGTAPYQRWSSIVVQATPWRPRERGWRWRGEGGSYAEAPRDSGAAKLAARSGA